MLANTGALSKRRCSRAITSIFFKRFFSRVKEFWLTGDVQSIARSGATLFAITGANIYRSNNNGANWADASGDLPEERGVSLGISALTTDAEKVFIATRIGIFATTDQGARWSNITGDLPFPSPLFSSPLARQRIRSLAVAGGALFVSIENSFLPFSPAPDADAQASMEITTDMASERPYFGVFKTTNNGMNWFAMNNGLQTSSEIQPIVNVSRLVVSGTRLYALSLFQLYFSNDLGANWTPISNNLPGGFSGSILIIISGGLPSSCLIVRGDNLYLSLPFLGLYLSRNNGGDWLPINIGLLETSLRGLEISGSKLFAATATGKLYVRTTM